MACGYQRLRTGMEVRVRAGVEIDGTVSLDTDVIMSVMQDCMKSRAFCTVHTDQRP
jgi:hypothetical protein